MNLTISHLHDAYKNQTLTPEQLVDSISQRCEQFKDHNIWIHKLSREELQPYLDNLKSKSVDDLPLYGIPFAIKDNIDLAGIETTAACPAFCPYTRAFRLRGSAINQCRGNSYR